MTTTELLEKATARPWKVDSRGYSWPQIGSEQYPGSIATVDVSCSASGKSIRPLPEAQANAELIVRAVNSFEALSQVSLQLIQWENAARIPGYRVAEIMELARKALALANGGGQ